MHLSLDAGYLAYRLLFQPNLHIALYWDAVRIKRCEHSCVRINDSLTPYTLSLAGSEPTVPDYPCFRINGG